jgi:hypothetical protein
LVVGDPHDQAALAGHQIALGQVVVIGHDGGSPSQQFGGRFERWRFRRPAG